MKNYTLESYLNNKKFFVISPHFDDALLSLGMLLFKLKDKADIYIINIFTKAHAGPYTFSARKFLNSSGFTNAEELYKRRLIEDKKALSYIDAKIANLGLTDALFRKTKTNNFLDKIFPELNHLYPTYRFHVTKYISKEDYAPLLLQKKLGKIISSDSIIFVPLGVGNHIDHVIARRVCEKLFTNIFYYSDFPYNLVPNIPNIPKGYQKVNLNVNLKIKSNLIRHYKSQVNMLFPTNRIPDHKEEFFIKIIYESKNIYKFR